MELIQEGQKLSLNIYKNDKLVEITGTVNKVFEEF